MAWYCCLILGEDFILLEEGRKKLFGFSTTRWVEASGAEAAEMTALELLKKDPTLMEIPESQRNSAARIYFESIEELAENPGKQGGGFTWFPMEEAEEK